MLVPFYDVPELHRGPINLDGYVENGDIADSATWDAFVAGAAPCPWCGALPGQPHTQV